MVANYTERIESGQLQHNKIECAEKLFNVVSKKMHVYADRNDMNVYIITGDKEGYC